MNLRRRTLTAGSALALAGTRASANPRAAHEAAGAPVFIYPAPESPLDRRSLDMVALLDAALSRTVARHGPYRLQPSAMVLTEGRQVQELQRGSDLLDLLWTTPTAEHLRQLRPVNFDTRRGLLGLRVALIRRSRQAEFDAVRTLADLRRFSVGQGHAWPDGAVYEAAGVRLMRAPGYESLFRMLMAGRFDLFPRGAHEVQAEWADRHTQMPDLGIESGLLLHYSAPYFFFVGQRHEQLAARLEQGLRAMEADGSFSEHLRRFHGAAVRALKLRERRVIRLRNPHLEQAADAADLAYWSK